MNIENMVFVSEENKEELFELDIRVYSIIGEGDGFFTVLPDVISFAGCVVTTSCAESSMR